MRTEGFKGVLLSVLMVAALVVPAISLSSVGLSSAAPDGLNPHGPIFINSNGDFTPANGVVGGSGTENDPYIIENWDLSRIYIANTTAHFVLRNCYVHSAHGIGLWGMKNGRIENNTCGNNSHGIYLGHSDNNTLKNNKLVNNRYNFEVSGSDLSHFIHDIDKTNLVNGKPIYYLIDNSNLVINQDNTIGYLGLISCDNIVVENLVFGSDAQGIFLAYTENSQIKNCAFSNNENSIYLWESNNNTLIGNTCDNSNGIHLDHSNNNKLIGNTCDNNCQWGIRLLRSDSNTLFGNTCGKNYSWGICLYGFSDNNTLSGNTFKDNPIGVYLGGHTQNNNNYIYHNNFMNNATQASGDGSNYWDNGYPSGGNYWSDYTGADNYRGENQDILGSDGIGDTPYYYDRYPLMDPWSPIIEAPPTITIISPIDNSTFVSSIVVEAYISDDTGLDSAWYAIDGIMVSTWALHGAENGWLWGSISGFEHGNVFSGEYFVLDNGTIITGWFSVTIINGQQYTVAVFAKDIHGNISSSKVYVTKATKAVNLSISPPSFTLQSGQSTTLTATLMMDENENRVPNKTITWSATSGSVDPSSGTTDASGEVSVLYTAPIVTAQTSVTVNASFVGDNQYSASSDNSYGTITVSPLQPAMVDIHPETLNLKSMGGWITCFIELPEGYDVADIDIGSIRLNGVVPAEGWPSEVGDHDHDGTSSLMVKFSRPAVQAIVSLGDVELTVTGLVNGVPFEGKDTIRVIKPGKVDLEIRFSEIPLEWALAPPGPIPLELEIELMEIPLYWALAPS